MSQPESTRPPLVFQSRIGAPPDAVFTTFFGGASDWLCRSGGFNPGQGSEFRLCWQDACVEGRFVQYAPPETGRFTWRFEGDDMPETMVVVSVAPGDGRTLLELEHYGFGIGHEWDMLYVGAARAWAGYLKNLRAVLEHGADLREPDE